jgi:hypothetical protein
MQAVVQGDPLPRSGEIESVQPYLLPEELETGAGPGYLGQPSVGEICYHVQPQTGPVDPLAGSWPRSGPESVESSAGTLLWALKPGNHWPGLSLGESSIWN